MFKKFLPSIKEYSFASIMSMVFVACEVALEVLIPFLMSTIIDVGLAENATSWSANLLGIVTISGDTAIGFILKIGGLMVCMAMLSLFFGAYSGRFAAVASTGFAMSLRQRTFDKVQDFSFGNIDKYSTPSLITRLTTDVNWIQMAYMMVIRVAVRAPIMLVLSSVMAFTIDSELALMFLVAVPLLAIGLGIIGAIAFPRFMKMLDKYDEMNAKIQENLIGIRVVKAFVREDYEIKRFKQKSADVRNSELRAIKVLVVAMPLLSLMMYACILLVCGVGGVRIVYGQMQTGEFMSFLSYISQVLISLMMLSMVLVMVVMSRASMVRICEVLGEEIEIKDPDEVTADSVANGEIEFKNVNFSYSKNKDNLTLDGINLKINSGETVGIVGGTGSAKTTLVQLIPRLYDVLDGELSVGGVDVRKYKIKTLRDSVAMVLQKNVLFSGSIKDNLKWGNAQATDEEIEEACRQAQAYDFITSFPDGFETELGQGGVNVSGGQKQRLCIARALLKKPKVLILDDSTSAVDTATDRKIREAFTGKIADTTVLIIAQRVASVAEADKIIVLEDGKINAIGTHNQLIESNDIYREVFESQQKGVAVDD